MEQKQSNRYMKDFKIYQWRNRLTTFLSCLETSSIPELSFVIATEISSFAGSTADSFALGFDADWDGYGSPASTAWA
jgi:hypothetical protein